MTRTHRLGSSSAILMALALSGCASTTVQPIYQSSDVGSPPPTMILVYRFAVSADEVTENQGFFARAERDLGSTPMSQEQQQTARQAAVRLAKDLATGIQGLGLPAAVATTDQVLTPNTVQISGAFVDINEGNRVRRLVIGFGAGEAKIDAKMRVAVWSGSSERVLARFGSHVDSGEMPGAAVTMGAGAAAQGGATVGMAAANVAVSGVKTYRSTDDQMIDRMAEKMVASLSQYFASQGWIPPSKVKTDSWTDL